MRGLLIWVMTAAAYLSPIFYVARAEDGPPAASASDPRCQALADSGVGQRFAVEFLTRLIWQESRFNDFAVSRAGAQGIAQFMPATASRVKLANPFDAVTAIDKSAQLLRDLRQQFGNLGLAAAAYNAGSKRVSDWLLGRRTLPQETVHYVQVITGHAPDGGAAVQPSTTNLNLAIAVPCPEIVQSFSAGRTVAA